ncbi:hypothetical protein PF008_g9015 [Phytophthora fragariae]|uniref:Uncharacterized protein n=1 Tax=Phytophthora fragariae TaxID=53985 RepID=A0A6G0RXZ6_9STRA|nr:hypothetical protein PF008_g9015 [Phytophthora fragariae]
MLVIVDLFYMLCLTANFACSENADQAEACGGGLPRKCAFYGNDILQTFSS